MNYATIKKQDIANGPGIRVSLFVSGCTRRCQNCFNPETWDFHYGSPFDSDAVNEILNALHPSYIKGFSLLGGEPFEPTNQIGVLPLLQEIKKEYPSKDIWCYTGYDFEKDICNRMLTTQPETKSLLSYIDVLVDGAFMEEKKDLNLRFCGSSNQRIIDVPESLYAQKLVLWNDISSFANY